MITDELREWAEDALMRLSAHEDLLAIADRIEAALAERYMELPVDADGEYIHIGDELRDEWNEQNQGEVEWLMLNNHGWWLMLKNNCERFYAHDFHEWHHRHHKPPTVEDVLRDFGVDIAHALDADPDATVPEATIAKYAAKLRLAGDEQ